MRKYLHLTPLGESHNSPSTRLELPASEEAREDPRPGGVCTPIASASTSAHPDMTCLPMTHTPAA